MIPVDFRNDYYNAVKKGNAPDYGDPKDISVVNGRYGISILMEFPGDRFLSPYFNQFCDEPRGTDYPETEREEVELDPDAFIESMAGATDWSDWEWTDTHPSLI
jgi:hypothetical protein